MGLRFESYYTQLQFQSREPGLDSRGAVGMITLIERKYLRYILKEEQQPLASRHIRLGVHSSLVNQEILNKLASLPPRL